ncbi:MAG: PilZ domain-containing protein [Nitrospira sp.]|nr:PilZ domain-containing protein [Nitrospira sp.]
MGKQTEYDGYTIDSNPLYEPTGNKWQLRIYISVRHSQGVRTRELASESWYATESEADIHGIAFGQRVIDGKVEGWSVWDMKTQDRRVTPRFRVQFRTTFSAESVLEGTGTILDLSAGGCRAESTASLMPGLALELRIYAQGLEWPLMVEAATVQWVSGQMFGLAFFRMAPAERLRLEQVIGDLTDPLT